jgi:hypothetical protein
VFNDEKDEEDNQFHIHISRRIRTLNTMSGGEHHHRAGHSAMMLHSEDEISEDDESKEYRNFHDDHRHYLQYHHQSIIASHGGVQVAEGCSPSPYHDPRHNTTSGAVSTWCVTPQRHDRSASAGSSSRRTKSNHYDATQVYRSSEDLLLPPPAVAAYMGGAAAEELHVRGMFSELSDDEDRTNVVPMSHWDEHVDIMSTRDQDCPKTAPRAPKKPMSSSCARRKAAASARWCSVSGAQGLTLVSMPSLTDDESESLSQPTFERIVALHRPTLDDEASCDPHQFRTDSSNAPRRRTPTAGCHDMRLIDYRHQPPMLQTAFDGLTLQSSPASKQLCFEDALSDDSDDRSPVTSRGSRHSGDHYHPHYSTSRDPTTSSRHGVMPTTDAAKHYPRDRLAAASQRGSSAALSGKTSARQRLLEQRRRRGRSDSQEESLESSMSPSTAPAAVLLASQNSTASSSACVTPPVRYTVSCPLFRSNPGDDPLSKAASLHLPLAASAASAALFSAVAKPPHTGWRNAGSSSDERPSQKPRLV